MKRILLLLVVICVILSACTFNSREDEPLDSLGHAHEQVIENLSEAEFQRLLTQTHPAEDLLRYLHFVFQPTAGHRETLADFNTVFSIEVLRDMGEGRLYTMHQADNGGMLYAFFASTPEGITQAAWLQHTAFVMKSLEINDFASIEVGSSVEAVQAIDPVVAHFKQNALMWEEQGFAVNGFISRHLLRDGLLVFTFHREGENFAVSDMQFHPDFTIAGEIHFDYSILPQDFPQ
ncbi:MAG: hypothetical protein FWD06_09975 [Oscillospiraceae bacterium]|nr:hypothetical protein [Oscillospiraceae bacterium]